VKLDPLHPLHPLHPLNVSKQKEIRAETDKVNQGVALLL
jgi:hypothetical protein